MPDKLREQRLLIVGLQEPMKAPDLMFYVIIKTGLTRYRPRGIRQ